MPAFSNGIPRWMVLSLALAILAAVPPETWSRGPDICLWKHLFHLAACPGCGSTRALAAFFHGHVAQALGYVVVVSFGLPGLYRFQGSKPAVKPVLAADPDHA